jgi:hypothetical protein
MICDHGVKACEDCMATTWHVDPETTTGAVITSDGGSTPDLWDIPPNCKDILDVAEALNMKPLQYNIFRAAYRWDRKAGEDLRYSLKKIIFCAERALEKLDSE